MRRIQCLFLAATVLMASSPRSPGGAPLPLVTFYGMLVDEFGWPYESNIQVELSANSKKILSRTLTPAQGRDYNFLVRIPYDSGGGALYTSDAIAAGDALSLKVTAVDSGEVLKTTNLVAAFPPGAVMNVNLSAGTDSVGDGLPDELRLWIWRNLGLPAPYDPTKIRAQDDSDGDTVSNLDEYRAGTDPANADDFLTVAMTGSGYPGVGQLSFYTVPGKPYEVRSAGLGAANASWTPIAFASSPAGGATNLFVVGTGHFLSVFVPTGSTNSFFRVSVTTKTGTALIP